MVLFQVLDDKTAILAVSWKLFTCAKNACYAL